MRTAPEFSGTTAHGSATRCTWRCRVECSLSRGTFETMRARRPVIYLALATAVVGLARPASAETIVLPGEVDLQAAIDRSADGDRLVLQGAHHGPIRITRKLTLE